MSSERSVGAPSRGRIDPAHLQRRHRAERRFRIYGAAAIGFALLSLVVLLASIGWRGVAVFTQGRLTLEVDLDRAEIDPRGTRSVKALSEADYTRLIREALREHFPEVSGRSEKRRLNGLLSDGASFIVRERVLEDPTLVGTTHAFLLPLSSEADLYVKGRVSRDVPATERKLSDQQMDWLDRLRSAGLISRGINWRFFTNGDSRESELAGVGGAVVGSALTLLVTLLACFPVGVAAAVHLEEFAPKNRLTDLIEVNINNLAAVPSIVFGLLGLAVFLGFFGMTRSAPLVGGLVLALRTLPVIIIVSRTALAAVPPSIREAALGLGASRLQLVTHHLLPLALPGILTGTIIGMAQALGETAPLLMVGMVAFVADVPDGLLAPATVLPVQIFLWSDAPDRGFELLTAGAIIVLLVFLLALNAVAVYLRQRFEVRY
jgi:phosphate transport system permease protein